MPAAEEPGLTPPSKCTEADEDMPLMPQDAPAAEVADQEVKDSAETKEADDTSAAPAVQSESCDAVAAKADEVTAVEEKEAPAPASAAILEQEHPVESVSTEARLPDATHVEGAATEAEQVPDARAGDEPIETVAAEEGELTGETTVNDEQIESAAPEAESQDVAPAHHHDQTGSTACPAADEPPAASPAGDASAPGVALTPGVPESGGVCTQSHAANIDAVAAGGEKDPAPLELFSDDDSLDEIVRDPPTEDE